MILAIPHSSTVIPYEYRNSFTISDNELQEENFYLTDHFTNELYRAGNQVICPVSRLLCDVERFITDEPMERIGMGKLYTKGTKGQVIRDTSRYAYDNLASELYLKYYEPYHRRLTYLAQTEIDFNGYSLVVDCHSFNYFSRPYEDDIKTRPDFCIGVNKENTPQRLVDVTTAFLKGKGFNVSINSPYIGAIIPNNISTDNCYSIMLEVNRKLYMDFTKESEFKIEKSRNFYYVQSLLDDLLFILQLTAENIHRKEMS